MKFKHTVVWKENWPESVDEYGTPKHKLPDCPRCENDELSMLNTESIFCNVCAIYFEPKAK